MKRLFAPLAAVVLCSPAAAQTQAACLALLQHSLNRLQDDRPQALCQFSGKVLLVVNTASQCSYTPQYKGPEAWLLRAQ